MGPGPVALGPGCVCVLFRYLFDDGRESSECEPALVFARDDRAAELHDDPLRLAEVLSELGRGPQPAPRPHPQAPPARGVGTAGREPAPAAQ